MGKIKSLSGLLLEELKDLYSAEKQLIRALPKMAQAATSDELKRSLENHLEETRNQAVRLEEMFKELGHKPTSVPCKAMKGLIEEGVEVVKKTQKGPARDAGIIGAAQRVEHYEIAAYETSQSYAALLGKERVHELLEETLEEEKWATRTLTEIAEGSVNYEANQVA